MLDIVVISGKGGTGKTSITAALASMGPPKVLADCDVDAADLHLVLSPEIREQHDFVSGEIAQIDQDSCVECGLCLEKCRFGAVSKDFRIIREHCEGCGLCYYVCTVDAVRMLPRRCGEWFVSDTRMGPMVHARLDIGEENSGKLVTTVRRRSAQLAQERGVDLILTDGSPGIGCPVIASLTNANLALVVTEPSRSAAHDLRRVLDLAKHFQLPALTIMNKVDLNPELAKEVERQCEESGAPVIARFGYHPAFTKAQLEAKSIVEYAPAEFSSTIENIWDRLLQHANRGANVVS